MPDVRDVYLIRTSMNILVNITLIRKKSLYKNKLQNCVKKYGTMAYLKIFFFEVMKKI